MDCGDCCAAGLAGPCALTGPMSREITYIAACLGETKARELPLVCYLGGVDRRGFYICSIKKVDNQNQNQNLQCWYLRGLLTLLSLKTCF